MQDMSLDDQLLLLARKFGRRGGRGVRRVRTPEGSRKYGLPIGAIITRDAINRAKKRYPGLQVPEDSDKRTTNRDGKKSAPKLNAAQLGEKLRKDPEFQNPKFSKPKGDQKVPFANTTFDFPSGTKVFRSRKNKDKFAVARTPDFDLYMLTPNGNAIDLKGEPERVLNERFDDFEDDDSEFSVESYGDDPDIDGDDSDSEDSETDYTEYESYEDVPEYLSDKYIADVMDGLSKSGVDPELADALEAQLRKQNDEIKQKWEAANDPVAAERNRKIQEIQDQMAALRAQLDALTSDSNDDDAPNADAPEADAPEADAPEADAPNADAPEADAPEADAPDADAPEADAPDADAPDNRRQAQSRDQKDQPKAQQKAPEADPDDAKSQADESDDSNKTFSHESDLKSLEDSAKKNPLGVGMGTVGGKQFFARRNRQTGSYEYSDSDGNLFETRDELIASFQGDDSEESDTEVLEDTTDMAPEDMTAEQIDAVVSDLEAGAEVQGLTEAGERRLAELKAVTKPRKRRAPRPDASEKKADVPESSTPSPGDAVTDSWLDESPAGSSVQSGEGIAGIKNDDGSFETPLGTIERDFYAESDVEDDDSVVLSPAPATNGRPLGAAKKLNSAKDLKDVRKGDSLALSEGGATATQNDDGTWTLQLDSGMSANFSHAAMESAIDSGTYDWWLVPNQDVPEDHKSRKDWAAGDQIENLGDLMDQPVGTKLRYKFKKPKADGSTESTYEVLPDGKLRKVGSPNEFDAHVLKRAILSGQLSVQELPGEDDSVEEVSEKEIASVDDYELGDKIVDYKHLKAMKPGSQITMTIPSKNNGGNPTTVVLTRTDDNKDSAGFMFLVGRRGAGYNALGENNASIFQAIHDGRIHFGDISRLPDADDPETISGSWDTTPNISLWDGGPMVSEYDLRTFIDAQIYSRSMQGSYYNTDLLPLSSPFRSQTLRKQLSEAALKKYNVMDENGKILIPARHKPSMIRYAAEKLGLQFTDPGAALIPDDLELDDFKKKVTVGKYANKNGKPSAESNKMGPERLEVTVADIKTALAVIDNMAVWTEKDRTKADKILKRVMAMRGSALQDMNVALGIASYFGVKRYKNGVLMKNIAAARQHDKRRNKALLRQMLLEQLEGREPGYYGLPKDETWYALNDDYVKNGIGPKYTKYTNSSTLSRPAINSDNDPNATSKSGQRRADVTPASEPIQVDDMDEVDSIPDDVVDEGDNIEDDLITDEVVSELLDPNADAPNADDPNADDPNADDPNADAPEADAPEADAPEADADAPEADADAPEADAPRTLDVFLAERGGRHWEDRVEASREASKAQGKEAWNSDAVYATFGQSTVKLKHVSKDREGYELDSSETEAFSLLAKQIHDSNISQADKDQLQDLMDAESQVGRRMFIDHQGSVIAAVDGDRIIGPFSLNDRNSHGRQEITKKAVRAGGRIAITPDDSVAGRLNNAGLVPTHTLPDGSILYSYHPEHVGDTYSGQKPINRPGDLATALADVDKMRKQYESSPFHIALDQGEMGDGFMRDANGKRTKMWGRHGAAGLMVRHVDTDGTERFFMTQRSGGGKGGKWQLAGGAINSKESDEVGAARELYEEVKPPAGWLADLKSVGTNRFDDSATGWHYSSIGVDSPNQFTPVLDPHEIHDAKWLTRQEIADMAANGELTPPVEASIRKTLALFGGTEADALPDPTKKDAPEVTRGSFKDEGARPGGISGGSNGGTSYWVPMSDGTEDHYFVKPAKSKDAGRQEALASALYREAGLLAPEVDFDEKEDRVYSKIIDGASSRTPANGIDAAREGFAADAWLANWDIRLGDNIMFGKDGTPIRLDNGGSLEYRAQGAKKGSGGTTGFGNKVGELDTLRQRGNYGHAIFGDKKATPDPWEISSAQKVVDIDDARIREMVKDHNLPKSLADTLIARRDDIASRYNLTPTPKTETPTTDEIPEQDMAEALSEAASPEPTPPTRGSYTDASATQIGDGNRAATGMAPVAGDWYSVPMSDGTTKDYAVTQPKAAEQGKSMALASKLYRALGVGSVDVEYDEGEDRNYAELIQKGDDPDNGLEEFRKGFVADAWLANWDAPNTSKFVYDTEGNPVRTDLRNALDRRVSGQAKPNFGNNVPELDTMRAQGPGASTYGARTNGRIDDWEYDGAQQVVDLSDDRIRDMVSESGVDSSLADTLIARRDYIAQHYGLRPSNDTSTPDLSQFEDVDAADSLAAARRAVGANKADYVRSVAGDNDSYLATLKSAGGVDKAFEDAWKSRNPDKPLRTPFSGQLADRTDVDRATWTADDDIDAVMDLDLSDSALGEALDRFDNSTPGGYYNATLRLVQEARGYHTDLNEVTADELDRMIAADEVHLVFRNKDGHGSKTGAEVLLDLKSDDERNGWWPGQGVYGDGVYVSTTPTTTFSYGSTTWAMGLRKDAKYISSTQIRSRASEIMAAARQRTDLTPEQMHNLSMLFDENYHSRNWQGMSTGHKAYSGQGMLGVAAAALGYDVVTADYSYGSGSWFNHQPPSTPVNEIYNVVNRGAMVFDDTKPVRRGSGYESASALRARITAQHQKSSRRTTAPSAAPANSQASRTTGVANATAANVAFSRGQVFSISQLGSLPVGSVFYSNSGARRVFYKVDGSGQIVGLRSGNAVQWINNPRTRTNSRYGGTTFTFVR